MKFLKFLRPKAIHFFTNFVLNNNYIQPIKTLPNISPHKINIVIANHISTVDFTLLLEYLGNYKNVYFVFKESIRYIPGVGQYMYFGNNIMVKRNWSEDKIHFKKDLEKLLYKTRQEQDRILVIFPEGTRISSQKKTNLDYDYLLPFKPMGLITILNYLVRNQMLGSFYDISMIPKNPNQDLFLNSDFFFKESSIFSDIFITLEEIDVSFFSHFTISWIQKIWKEKDTRFRLFYRNLFF